jgi:MarR family transcriptional regulator for hemolysin
MAVKKKKATKRAKVAKVAKAIAQGRGTADISAASLPGKQLGPLGREIDDDAGRDGIRLSFLIHDVSRMRRSAYDQFMKPLSITRAQWWVLAHLSRHDGMMQTQLADVLEVGKASLGTVIEKLETDGWVMRREDPSDKRAKRVYLTRPGHNLIGRMTNLELDFNNHVLADLSPEERAATTAALQKIKSALSRMDRKAGSGSDDV